MSQTSGECTGCPRHIEIKFSTGHLIAHRTPEGEPCEGSGRPPKSQPVEAEHHEHQQCTCSLPPAPKAKRKRKTSGKGGSVHTVSGGLPGLGKRR